MLKAKAQFINKMHPPIKGSQEIKNKTQKTAMHLMLNEEAEAKKSRLSSLLVQQLIGKYGSRSPNSAINTLIQKNVEDFINSRASDGIPIEQSLQQLEQQVKEVTTILKRELSMKKAQMERLKREGDRTKYEGFSSQAEADRMKKSFGFRSQDLDSVVDTTNWGTINAALALQDEEKALKEKQDALARQEKFRRELNAQKAAIDSKKIADLESKKKDLANVSTATASFEQEKLQNWSKKVVQHAHQRTLIESQIEQKRSEREREREQKILAEQRDMERARYLAEVEEEKIRIKKEQQKKIQDRLIEDNEKNKKVKEEMKRKQAEEEIFQTIQYERKLILEEERRAAEFKSRVDALKKVEDSFQKKTGTAIAEAQAKTEALTQAHMEKKYEADKEKERLKQQKIAVENQRNRDFNATLIEAKEKKKQMERELDIERRKQAELDIQRLREREAQALEAKKARMQDLKSKLDEQVADRYRNSREQTKLSDLEKKLNQGMIAKLAEKPEMLDKLVSKVKPTHNYRSVGFTYG